MSTGIPQPVPQEPRLAARLHNTQKPRRSRQKTLVIVLILLVMLGVVGAFEEGIRSTPVDSFTFTAHDAYGKLLAAVSSHDAQEAQDLRQRINALPRASSVVFPPIPTVVACTEPLYNGPIGSYRYDFYWHSVLVETVWVDDAYCAGAWASSGGISIALFGRPIVPKGVHLPPAQPWSL